MYRRAHFIWTPDQAIRPEAFEEAFVNGVRRRDDGQNRWVLFRRVFHLAQTPGQAQMRITCDGRYRAYINGMDAGRGPVRCSPHRLRFDVRDVAPLLCAGVNTIGVIVHCPGVDCAWYETQKGPTQPVFGDGGLYVELDCDEASVSSGPMWRCIRSPAWRQHVPRAGWGLGFIEDFDARAFPRDWLEPSFDDAHWMQARPMVAEGDRAALATGTGRLQPIAAIAPSGLPPFREADIAPLRIVGAWTVLPHPGLAIDRRLWEEPFVAEAGPLVIDCAGMVEGGVGAIIRTTEEHDVAILAEFAANHAGRPFIEIEAQGGEVIDILASERALPECGTGRRLTRVGIHAPSPAMRYRARAGAQRIERFDWTAVRTLQITVREAPEGLRIQRVGSRATHFPVQSIGEFACSDPVLTKLWSIGRHTVLQCAQDGWIDCPGREQRQWIGDVAVTMDAAAVAFGPSVDPLNRFFLETTAERQRSDGLMPMFAPGDSDGEGVTIPDFTLHWVRLMGRYFWLTEDVQTLSRLLPHAERALAWFKDLESGSGLLADIPHWHFIEWAHLGREGESAPINALYADALNTIAQICERLDRRDSALRYRSRAMRVERALNDRHWDEARGVYVDSVDAGSGRQHGRVSQTTNALMIACGFAPAERWGRMLGRIADENRLRTTPAPPVVTGVETFDDRHDVVRANTFFSHFVNQAFAKAGRIDLALNGMRAHYGPMLSTGATTLWESFEPGASLCHGFSAGPVYALSTFVLGAAPIAAGRRKFEIRPQPGDLRFARGAVPTANGPLYVEWAQEAGSLAATVRAPPGIDFNFAAPPGYELGDIRDSRHARFVRHSSSPA